MINVARTAANCYLDLSKLIRAGLLARCEEVKEVQGVFETNSELGPIWPEVASEVDVNFYD